MKAELNHLGIIMDGNGRWAVRRGLPRSLGHKAGIEAAKRIVESAHRRGIAYLTLYAFSADNWSRERREVDAIFRLVDSYLTDELQGLVTHGVRVQVIGRRDRLPTRTRRVVERAERVTADGNAMLLRLAVDYPSRDALVAAAAELVQRQSPESTIDRTVFFEHLNRAINSSPVPDIDLVIRTSGEQRLSDFCLWECAYAELFFTPVLWPDFDDAALAEALTEYANRQRRFGSTTPAVRALGAAS